jgi:hypothetical protein
MGWLDQLLRRAAPGDVPADPMAGSVMSPNYVPETSRRQLGLGALRGVLDLTPVGVADAVQAGINNMQSPLGAAMRAVAGKSALPGDVALGKLGLLGSGPGYDAGRYAANAAAPMTGLLGNQAGGALPKGYARNQSGAIVWHGSPHKFDRFDARKIGTGEGAQAYGHGLYLAESPKVAESYAKVLPSRVDTAEWYADKALPQSLSRAEFDELGALGRDMMKMGNLPAQKMQRWRELNDRKRLFDDAVNEARPKSNLYKVDLPDDAIARMLDYDKPLSQQAHEIQRALMNLPTSHKINPDMTGGALYQSTHLVPGLNADKINAAEKLKNLGIPGIRYLDGGSRGTGSGTSNFVVFPGNEGLLNILERNGQPLR